jgi:hypothetical protein
MVIRGLIHVYPYRTCFVCNSADTTYHVVLEHVQSSLRFAVERSPDRGPRCDLPLSQGPYLCSVLYETVQAFTRQHLEHVGWGSSFKSDLGLTLAGYGYCRGLVEIMLGLFFKYKD